MPWPLDIVLFSNGLPHDGATLTQRSLGGSETAAICIAKALAARGHHVTVFSPCQGGLWDDVEYRSIDGWGPYVTTTPHDITIVSRDYGALAAPILSHLKVLWCHDLALRRNRNGVAGLLWQLDALYVMSQYQLRHYQQVFQGIPDSVYRVTRNGIRLTDFPGLPRAGRDMTKLIYASRPERGLENALAIMDLIGKVRPDIWLGICGYENNPPQLQGYYQQLAAQAAAMPNVKQLGCLPQREFYRELCTAAALIEPGPGGAFGSFKHIFAIILAESLAAATPVIAGARGAIPETCGEGTSVLIGDDATDCHSPAYRQQFADAVLGLLGDAERWKALSVAGRKHALTLDWAGVAEQWETWWLTDLAARTADRTQVLRTMREVGEREGAAWLETQAA